MPETITYIETIHFLYGKSPVCGGRSALRTSGSIMPGSGSINGA